MDMVGYIYTAGNFPRTFKENDKLYVQEGPEMIQGKIHLLQLADGLMIKRLYRQENGGCILMDEVNPPQIESNPAIIGHVVGYERMFSADD